MKYVAAIAAALALFAAVQLAVKGPNPAAESMVIEVRPAALKLSQLVALAGLPEFRQYAAAIAAANSSAAQELRKLAALVKALDDETTQLAAAAAAKNATAAQTHYANAKSLLEQIRKTLTSLGLWDAAKDYYTAAYLRIEALRRTAEEKPKAKLWLDAPTAAEAGSRVIIRTTVEPPNGTLFIYLDGALINQTRIAKSYTVTVAIRKYTQVVEISAVYVSDDQRYGTAENKTVIRVVYKNATLALQCPPEVKWGDTLTVAGTTNSPAKAATIRLGRAAFNVTVSEGRIYAAINTTALAPGVYNLTVSIPPSGAYAPASASCTVNITAPPPPLRLPTLLIAGLPTAITDHYYYTPNIFEPTGTRKFSIYVPPNYPYAGAYVEFTATVVNPLQIGAAAALAAFLAATAAKRARAVRAPPPAPTPYTYAELAAMYLRQAAAKLGIALKPGTTIRELLSAVREVDEEVYRKLAKVGRRLEEVLYAGEQPTPQDYEELR